MFKNRKKLFATLFILAIVVAVNIVPIICFCDISGTPWGTC